MTTDTTIERKSLLELMNESEAVYLATVEGAVPKIRALVNLRRRDIYPGPSEFCRGEGFTVYLTTSALTGKVWDVAKHPIASAYYCTPPEFRGLALTGPVEILTEPALRKILWDESWRVYFPKGDEDPDYVVLRIKPAEAEGWWGRKSFRLTAGDL